MSVIGSDMSTHVLLPGKIVLMAAWLWLQDLSGESECMNVIPNVDMSVDEAKSTVEVFLLGSR